VSRVRKEIKAAGMTATLYSKKNVNVYAMIDCPNGYTVYVSRTGTIVYDTQNNVLGSIAFLAASWGVK
jgi:hypothetical protein